ncbi:MAG: hypothetical protein JWM85_2376 [Acidimicrobiaceae bacterium]|nr:hypothetical protein [Acidimicrobiaceae bacterium]
MDYDQQGLGELLEESQDLHADAMRSQPELLAEATELGQQPNREGTDRDEATTFAERRRSLAAPVMAGTGLGLGLAIAGLAAGAASAASATDVQILQTQQSLENLAIATYGVALTLPFIGGHSANPVVKAFVMKTRSQHQDHDNAFGSLIKSLGGKPQNSPDPVLLKVVNKAKPGLKSAAAVVALALELEDGAAATYVRDAAILKSVTAKKLTASIMGVEAQHAAVLRAVQALLAGGAAGDIALPPPVAALPAAAGKVGFPNPFFPTAAARPLTEGSVR